MARPARYQCRTKSTIRSRASCVTWLTLRDVQCRLGSRTRPSLPLAKLSTSLLSTTDILRGSLLQRRIRHRSSCAVCARGEGHLISVLTVSYPGGRTRQISLRPEQKPIVEQWLRNYRKIKATLERICELNHQRLLAERNADR